MNSRVKPDYLFLAGAIAGSPSPPAEGLPDDFAEKLRPPMSVFGELDDSGHNLRAFFSSFNLVGWEPLCHRESSSTEICVENLHTPRAEVDVAICPVRIRA